MFARHVKPLPRMAAVIGLSFVALEFAGCKGTGPESPEPEAAMAAAAVADDGGPITVQGRARWDKNTTGAVNVHFDVKVTEGGETSFTGHTVEVWWATKANEADPPVYQAAPTNPYEHTPSDQIVIENFQGNHTKNFFQVKVKVLSEAGGTLKHVTKILPLKETFTDTFDQFWYTISTPAGL